MGSFDISYGRTAIAEGTYSNDPVDPGGETFCGISRKIHPEWEGWAILDQSTDKKLIPELKVLVMKFYKPLYWDAIQGDYIENQDLCNVLYDIAVNMGASKAALFLQKSLNALNKNGSLYSDIPEQGNIGVKTLGALKVYLLKDSPFLLCKVINILRGAYYIEIMRSNPSQEKYARGWFNRVTIV